MNASEADNLLNIARQQCEQQAFGQAEAICLDILRSFPEHDLAMNQLGVIAFYQQKFGEAVRWWQQVLAVNPRAFVTHINLGTLFYAQQQYANALQSFTDAVNLEPDNFSALINKANTLLALEQFSQAIDVYQMLIKQYPDRIDLHSNKGLALFRNNQPGEAEPIFIDILAKQPNYLPALVNYSNVLLALKKYEQCEIICQKIINSYPDHIDSFACLSNALLAMDQHEKGLSVCDKGLALAPTSTILLLNKARCCRSLGDIKQALLIYNHLLTINADHLEALESRAILYLQAQQFALALTDFEKVIMLDKENTEALCNAALTLSRLKRYEESVALYDRALLLKPNEPSIFMDKAAVFSHLSRHTEAIEHYKKALSLQPDNDTIAVIAMSEAQHACDWGEFYKNIELLKTMIAKPVMQGSHLNVQGAMAAFLSLILPGISAFEQLQCARKYIDTCFKATPKIALKRPEHQPPSKLRIGYLSGDFRRHAVSQLLVEVLELHNRDEFTVIAFSYGTNDGSALRVRVEKAVDHFVDLSNKDVAQAATTITEMNIDVLIDLGGHTESGRPTILAHKPAPVQIEYLGYLGTTGADFIDYMIADHFLIHSDEERYYAEKIIYLPSYQANDRQCEIAAIPTRKECNLPEEAIVFCCFNVPQKITPIMFDVWCRLLAEVTDSVLWLFVTNEESKSNLIKEAQHRGIDASRLRFAGVVDLSAHLARLQCADVFLDTLPYNAGATASNALWAGVPVVTCAGDTFSSRMAGSLLTALGVPELITYNLQNYFKLALDLATDSQRRQDIRQKILLNKATAPLFDTPTFTAQLEIAYKQAVEEKLG